MKLDASQTATETALVFYNKHQAAIQKVDTTRQQLKQMTEKCSDYRIVINKLREFEGEKERELATEVAAIDEDRKELDFLKEQAARQMQQFVEEKREFEDMKRTKEAEQVLKLQEKKAELEREHNKQYDKRVADLEKVTKKSQDDDKKKITDLQSKNGELVGDLEEQRRRLKDAEKRCKDIEKLRSLSDTEVEDLSQKLKMAVNEFGLCANTNEYL
jgi:chromosome segregation ATPase